jgi:hypothetical protein
MGPATPALSLVWSNIMIGLGIGFVLPLLNIVVQNAFPYRMMGMISATQQFLRSVGAVIAVSIMGMVMVTVFTSQLTQRIPEAVQMAIGQLPPEQQEALTNPQGLISAETQAAIRTNFVNFGERGEFLYRQFIVAVQQSLTAGVSRVFSFGVVFAALALLATLIMKELPLQRDEFFQGQGKERS